MNARLSIILLFLVLCGRAAGWIIPEAIDHRGQLERADFAGIVEVVRTVETGASKAIWKEKAAFREIKLTLNVVSVFKGRPPAEITCRVYREPTREELISDGVKNRDDLRLILLNLGTGEELHLYPARVKTGDVLLAYLVSGPEGFSPVSGDLKSSRSLLKIEPASLLNGSGRDRRAETDGTAKPSKKNQ